MPSGATRGRALAHLKKLGLIETKQALYGNLNILHIRLTKQANSVLQLDHSQYGDSDAASSGESEAPPSEGCEAAPLYKVQGDTPEEVLQEEHCVLSHATSPPGVDEESKTGKSYNETLTPAVEEETVGSTNDVGTYYANSAAALVAEWRAAVVEVYGSYVVPLTAQQRRQLKCFLSACPPDTAAAVLDYAVMNWSSFTEQAETDAGAFNMPAKPEIGFLTKYREVVINMWLANQKKASSTLAAKKTALPNAAPAIKTPVPAKELTPEQVYAILGEPN